MPSDALTPTTITPRAMYPLSSLPCSCHPHHHRHTSSHPHRAVTPRVNIPWPSPLIFITTTVIITHTKNAIASQSTPPANIPFSRHFSNLCVLSLECSLCGSLVADILITLKTILSQKQFICIIYNLEKKDKQKEESSNIPFCSLSLSLCSTICTESRLVVWGVGEGRERSGGTQGCFGG